MAFDAESQREGVTKVLDQSLLLPNQLCIHGFKVTAKKRTLKRRRTLLKHARFLQNMEVFPIYPKEPEPKPEGEEEPEDD